MNVIVFLLITLTGLELAWFTQVFSSENKDSQRIEQIDEQLSKLALFHLRTGFGPIGYRSMPNESQGAEEWVKIIFDKAYEIDQVVIVPNLYRESGAIARPDGLPDKMEIVVTSPEGEDQVFPLTLTSEQRGGIAPLLVNIPCIEAQSVTLRTKDLSLRRFDQKYVLQLSELLVFSGPQNVALNQRVEVKSEEVISKRWGKNYINDGGLPFIMDSQQGEKSIAYIAEGSVEKEGQHRLSSLTLDLGGSIAVNTIHVHPMELGDNVPQATRKDFNFPEQLIIEGALKSNFTDSVILVDYQERKRTPGVYPIEMWRFPEIQCRYIRIKDISPLIDGVSVMKSKNFGFAEIEIPTGKGNIALGKSFKYNLQKEGKASRRDIKALTDGRNLYGKILGMKVWMAELATRQELEAEREILSAQISSDFLKQSKTLAYVYWLLFIVVTCALVTFILLRRQRVNELKALKKRFVADLHDELGANIHSIGLISDVASSLCSDNLDLQNLHQRIRNLTERTGVSIRNFSHMIEGEEIIVNLVEDMNQFARRTMSEYDYEVKITGEEFLSSLTSRKQLDLFLFYKEALVNIFRHAEATSFEVVLSASPSEIQLSISDNGCGLSFSDPKKLPTSLRRRAAFLKANLATQSSSMGGASIILTLKR